VYTRHSLTWRILTHLFLRAVQQIEVFRLITRKRRERIDDDARYWSAGRFVFAS
jgi:hypothetical protein